MIESRNAVPGVTGTDSLGGLLDIKSAPVTFGYEERDAVERADAVPWNHVDRPGPIGWWSRHRFAGYGVGLGLATTLAFLPALQDAMLMVLTGG